MIAAVGVVFLPAALRTIWANTSLSRCQTPSKRHWRNTPYTVIQKIPYTTCRYECQRHVCCVTRQHCTLVPEVKTRCVPYTTCHVVKQDHCKMVTCQRCYMVPEVKERCIPYTTCHMVRQDHCKMVVRFGGIGIDPDRQPKKRLGVRIAALI